MKSLIRTMIVLAVLCFAVAAVTPAPGMYEGTSDESGNQVSTPVVAAPSSSSKEPVPQTPPPSVGVVPPASDEPAVIENITVSVEPSVIPSNRRKIVSTLIGGKSSNVLVIPDTDIKAEDVAAITQDMQIMSHIFQKIFTGPRLIEGAFIDYGPFFGRGSRATQAIYLQGYGTLFLLEVDFPFSPPTKPKEKAEDTKEADSVWQRAKLEIFSPTRTIKKVVDSENKYDAEKVEELKTRLIKALKHSANIRNIKPDEWIILTVIGEGGGYSGTVGSGIGGYGGYGGVSEYSGYGSAVNTAYRLATKDRYTNIKIVPKGIGVTSSTVLTIRAKKSDVDAFAKGDLDYDKFREKVQILMYPSWGQQVGQEVHLPALNPEPEVR